MTIISYPFLIVAENLSQCFMYNEIHDRRLMSLHDGDGFNCNVRVPYTYRVIDPARHDDIEGVVIIKAIDTLHKIKYDK